MYAYIDETGNTGQNLFDAEQPTFMYGALIARTDFDTEFREYMSKLASDVGQSSLHASELGVHRLESVAGEILHILVNAHADISLCRVIKLDLAITKLVDVLFDSGENLAVPWHVYNLRPMRYLNVIKIAYLLDRDILSKFWNALMEPNQNQAYEQMRPVLAEMLSRVNSLPDQRSREIIGQAIQWAMDNPEAIHYYSNSRALRNGHLPNMAVFPELLGSIETKSQEWQQPVIEIRHDRQSQFDNMLKEWHALFSTATADPLVLPFGEKHVFRRVFGSKFTVCSPAESPGIQVIDTILWLIRRIEGGEKLPDSCAKLVGYCAFQGYMFELSLQNIVDYLDDFFRQLQSVPLTSSQLENAERLLQIAEDRRQQNMREYAQKKLAGETFKGLLPKPTD